MKKLLLLALAALPALAQTPPLTFGDYQYDGAGNIIRIGNDVYVYDQVGRLTSGGAGPGRSQAYSYDAFGNITRIVTDGNGAAPRIPGVDALTNRMSITTGGATTYGTYDAAGRMTGYVGPSTYAMSYDGADMVRELSGGGVREVYVYTADDERLAVASLDSAGAVSSWRWSLRGLDNRVLRQFDQSAGGTWSWREDFIYAAGQLIAAETPAPTRTLHFFNDHLGTPRLITGNGGATMAKHTYYPFGEEVTSPAQDTQAMKFTGHERDFSGLDYMHARFYGAGAGRFLTGDWARGRRHRPQSWDRYSYTWNSPIDYIDPDGQQIYVVAPRPSPDEAIRDLDRFVLFGQQFRNGFRDLTDSHFGREIVNVSYLTPGDFFSWQVTAHGAEAFVDGVIPDIPFCDSCAEYTDPFEGHGFYDVNEPGMRISQGIGVATREVELALVTSGSESLFGQGKWINTGKNFRLGHSTQLIKGAPNRVWFSARGRWVQQLTGKAHVNAWIVRFLPPGVAR